MDAPALEALRAAVARRRKLKLTNADRWPASQRGDAHRSREGWEELHRWERAHCLDTTVGDERTLAMQLDWLASIRERNRRRDRRAQRVMEMGLSNGL